MDKRIEEIFKTEQRGRIYRKVIEDAEKILIERALAETEGQQITAAALLGINRNTLRCKIRKLRINPKRFRL